MITSTDEIAPKTADFFLLDPSNKDFVNGKANRIGSSSIMLWAAVVAFITAALCLAIVLEDRRLSTQFKETGIETEGMVTRHYTNQGGDGGQSTYYRIEYIYTVGTRRFHPSISVSSLLYSRLKDGESIRIRYLPDDPARTEIWSETGFTHYADLTYAHLVGLAAFGAGVSCLWRNWRNRLFSRGQIIYGEIEDVEAKFGYRSIYNVVVYYRFTAPDGTEISSSAIHNRPDLLKKRLPDAGTPVSICYVNNKTYRLM
jgi:hypothetical protein